MLRFGYIKGRYCCLLGSVVAFVGYPVVPPVVQDGFSVSSAYLLITGEPNLMGHASARPGFRYSITSNAFSQLRVEPVVACFK
jgi:hypothetical protein